MLPGESRNADIIRLHLTGNTQRQIVSAVAVSFSKISQVIQHYNKTGSILPEIHLGRPSKAKDNDLRAFVAQKTPKIGGFHVKRLHHFGIVTIKTLLQYRKQQ